MGVDISVALAAFTVLAPAGAVAFALSCLRILALPHGSGEAARIERCLLIPIAACMVGLIASALHLGTPANALYVFMGVGRSPLSNEVLSAVAFLSLAWLYWLVSFVRRLPLAITRAWLLAACVAALFMVARISVVYDIPTIPTWSSPYVPASLWAVALATGPHLCLLTLTAAERARLRGLSSDLEGEGFAARGYCLALVALSAAAVLAGTVLMALQCLDLPGIVDSFGSAADLVPAYGACVAAFCLLSLAGNALAAGFLGRLGKVRFVAGLLSNPLVLPLAALLVVLLAAAIVRVPFYDMHMTVGF